ncbi:pyridoxamine 5'-phosphate oxidase [Mycobacterium sp. CBMA 213]|uniref:pyridoxamine 5'-phosphate oxidase family protein n=1 Tax=Mycolicibacterium sp. CBMA 213 TaxID=1968788 RepID=UPI0012DEB25E|nr:pyridoxamine 5'-phosphate oxidase family protein [Mycolicibacterium sp. CBMA 213]MUM04626.1 pyridoxamine 5'-phosphate oxidase [Mycolicibacterium sp. CBMA 213]
MENTGGSDEWAYDGGLGLARLPVGAQAVGPAAALQLLASIDYGRVVFTLNALPAVRPVNHLLDGGRIIIRTRLTSAIARAISASEALVVAYEADQMDLETRTGWSVVVAGRAYTVTEPAEIAEYERRLHPWVNHADTVVAIEPDIVTGYRINTTNP